MSTAKWRPAYAKPLRQAGNVAGLSAVAAPSPKQLWRVGDLAKAGGVFNIPINTEVRTASDRESVPPSEIVWGAEPARQERWDHPVEGRGFIQL